jgi:hypothetical protein
LRGHEERIGRGKQEYRQYSDQIEHIASDKAANLNGPNVAKAQRWQDISNHD